MTIYLRLVTSFTLMMFIGIGAPRTAFASRTTASTTMSGARIPRLSATLRWTISVDVRPR